MTGRVAALLTCAALTLTATMLASPAALAVALAAAAVPVLVDASPQVGAVLDSPPDAVTLTFDQTLVGGRMVISGPNGFAGAGTVTVSGNTLSKGLRDGTSSGTYTVTWRARAAQGKAATGTYTFTVGGSTPTSSAPSPSTSTGGSGGNGGTSTPTSSSTPVAGVPTGAGATTGSPGSTTSRSAASGVVSGTRSAPAVTRSGAPGPTRASGASPSVTAKDTLASNPVGALAAKSRELGPWLIGFAVLLQAVAGLFGLWRWRRTASDNVTEAATVRQTVNLAEPEGPWTQDDDLDRSKILADRPWTGELPLRRSSRS